VPYTGSVRAFLPWLLSLPLAWAQANPAAELVSRLRTHSLDAEACYRVRDVSLYKQDVRIFFTDGYLILGEAIDGYRYSAVFTADVPGGDAEILLLPPTRSERLSLATFTGSPNLNEHFDFAVMVFTDDTASQLERILQSQFADRKSLEMGALLRERWGQAARNFVQSFATRIIFDRFSGAPASEGFFYMGVRGRKLGGFDIIYDPLAPETIQVGQVRFRDNRTYFDVWTRFPARNAKTRSLEEPLIQLDDYQIEATLEPDLTLRCVTRARLATRRPLRVLVFDLAQEMQVSQVFLDGQPCEIWQRASLRADLLRGSGLFLVLPPSPLEPGRAYQIEFHHAGRVVRDAGNGVYYVEARGLWYPRHGWSFAHYQVCFRYPDTVQVVFPGQLISSSAEEGWCHVCRRTEEPVRLIGFNLGNYISEVLEKDGIRIEVYANRRVEQALEQKPRMLVVPQEIVPPARRGRGGLPQFVVIPTTPPPPDPTARMSVLSREVGEVFQFLQEILGPPPTRRLAVSPIPGTFGQGFPGLLYLSTLAYLHPEERPEPAKGSYQELFFSEILHAHETAHQWWGNVVTAASYQEEWVMEALANYSALMFLERKRGPAALRQVLASYRAHLLATDASGKPIESAGPICWGERLNSSRADAYRVIVYEKGSWIIHMLRRRLGEDGFLAFLRELSRRFRYKSLTIEQFRQLAAEFLPPEVPDPGLENFFDQWVFDVGIPRLRCSYKVQGKAPRTQVTLRVEQSGVPDSFSVLLPVEIELADGRLVRRWLRTSSQPVVVTLHVNGAVSRVTFNPGDATLAVLD